jgi:hypothetical protein
MSGASAGGDAVASASVRRPLPALAFLLMLSVLTALVWWRVINRAQDDGKAQAQPSCATSTSAAVTAVPRPAAVTVTVLNATQRTGLAALTTATLRKDGFGTGAPDNDTAGVVIRGGAAEVRYGPTGKAAATLLSYYFPGSVLVPVVRSDAQVVVSLGPRFTAVAAPAAVAKTLAAKRISQLPATRAGNLVQAPSAQASTGPAAHC